MRLDNVCVSFGQKSVLKDFSAEINSGITCIIGSSGSGKTTLLRVIAGLQKISSGNISNPPKNVSVMFQEDRLLPWLTAKQNIIAVLSAKNKTEIAQYWLEKVELANDMDSYPQDLSGGMQRRVALARALAYGGDMLLLDEPFKGLDTPLVHRLLPLVLEQTIPVLVSTHSSEEITALGGKTLSVN